MKDATQGIGDTWTETMILEVMVVNLAGLGTRTGVRWAGHERGEMEGQLHSCDAEEMEMQDTAHWL